MLKKRIKYHQRRITLAIKSASRSDLTLNDYLSLRKSIAEHKACRRKERRHGTYISWEDAEDFLGDYAVPIKLNNDNSTVRYLVVDKNEIKKKVS
jgi:hypothetical protein